MGISIVGEKSGGSNSLSFLLGIVLLTTGRGNRVANRILAATLMLFSIIIVLHTFSHTEHAYSLRYHEEVVTLLFLLISPFIYLYVKALTEPPFRFGKKPLLHFIPFAICTALLVPFYLQPAVRSETTGAIGLAIAVLAVGQAVGYVFAAVRSLQTHARAIQTSFSSTEKINLNWLRYLILAYAITWLVGLSLEGHGGEAASWNAVWILVSVLMYAIGYMGLRQPEIFIGISQPDSAPDEAETQKYERSTLTPENAEVNLQKLQQVMEEKKPHLDSDLTLAQLAGLLAISSHHLSQIINERLGQNFFEFVNCHRVEEARKMLIDEEHLHLNISAIGFDAGFNSVSAFNAAFKKHAGMTPSQYRKSSR